MVGRIRQIGPYGDDINAGDVRVPVARVVYDDKFFHTAPMGAGVVLLG